MRFVVHDEDGPLRRFQTRAEALAWMLPGMSLQVLPKPPKPPKINPYDLAGPARW